MTVEIGPNIFQTSLALPLKGKDVGVPLSSLVDPEAENYQCRNAMQFIAWMGSEISKLI